MSGDTSLNEASAEHRQRARDLVLKTFRERYSPPPELSVSEWADAYRVLSPKASAIPGAWKTDRTPYLREPMDMLSTTSDVERVVVMKGHQLGFTDAGNNWIGYTIDHAPGPMLMMMPSMGLVKRNTRLRIDPLIQSSERLDSKIAAPQSRAGGNTVEQKDFPGGSLMMCGANSPNPLSSVPIKNLFCDECDRYPTDVGDEGDPVSLAENRTTTYEGRGRKVYIVSTPGVAGVSIVYREFLSGDQRRYFVPCPHCMHKQWLQFKQFKWEKGKPETVRFHCEECDDPIDERHKPWMLANGEWRPTAEGDGVTVSYHISTWYSPFATWESRARKWDAANNNPLKRQVCVNQDLGEPWKDAAEAPEWRTLYDRAEDRPLGDVPLGGLLLTAGVDVQKNPPRVEVSVYAWGRRQQCWLVDHRILPGDPYQNEVWDDLTEVLNDTWQTESGAEMSITAMAADTGYAANQVYKWVRKQPRKRVMAVKGRDRLDTLVSSGSPVEVNVDGKKIKRGCQLFKISTSDIKTELYGQFKLEPPTAESGALYPQGYRHFPRMGEEFFKQLCGEQLMTQKDKAGRRRYGWHQTYSNVEALDCYVYARAAAHLRGQIDRDKEPIWKRHEEALGIVYENGRYRKKDPRRVARERAKAEQEKATPTAAIANESKPWIDTREDWFS